MDRYTFGKTPAALYLADHLNILNDKKLTRKISSKIHAVQTIIAEALKSHEAGTISTHTLSFIASTLRERVMTRSQQLLSDNDELSVNLMTNILIGELKSLIRKAQKIKHLKRTQDQILSALQNSPFPIDTTGEAFRSNCGLELVSTKEVLTVKKLSMKDVVDQTTAESLIERSRAKLERLGKKNTLYGE